MFNQKERYEDFQKINFVFATTGDDVLKVALV